MGWPVVTVASGGLPVVESTTGGTPVTEAANGYGTPVTKVVGKPGLPVVFETIGAAPVFSGAAAGKSANQVAANYSTNTAISWDAAGTDTGGFWSAGNPTKLIVPASANGQYGVVMCGLWIDNISATTNSVALCLLKGGTNFVGMSGFRRGRLGGNGEGFSGVFVQARSQPVLLATGDEFTATLQVFGDTAVDILAARSSFCIYTMTTPGVLVSDVSGTTAQNYNFTTINTWDTTAYDPYGFFSGAAPGRLTVPSAVNGRYAIVKANILLANATANTDCAVQILRNGIGSGVAGFTEVGGNLTRTGTNDTGNAMWIEVETQPVLLATGDYFEVSLKSADISTDMLNLSTFGVELMPVAFQGVLCKRTTDQLAANYSAGGAQIPFDAEIYDTDGCHDTVTNNHQLIIPASLNDKRAILMGNMYSSLLTTSSSGAMSIRRGGTGDYPGFGGSGGDTGTFTNNLLQARSQIVTLATGQAFTCQVFINDSSITVEQESTTFGLRVLG
jgi:hypothetical protein